MKHLFQKIYIGFFFLLILAPLLLIPWVENPNAEKRVLADMPSLITDGGLNLNFSTETEEFFTDHFAGRTWMIDTYSRLMATAFGVSANDKVIMGKDGWLFFRETLGDYTGENHLSQDQMQRLLASLLLIRKTVEEQGKDFVLVIAPNKNSIYADRMPDALYQSHEAGNYRRIMDSGFVPVVDLRTYFVQKASESASLPLYFRTDTHWNGYGARLGAGQIIDAIASMRDLKAAQEGISSGSTEYRIGDLAQMLYPMSAEPEEDIVYPDTMKNYETIGRFRSEEDMRITTHSDGVPLSLFVMRDSFGNALLPYLSNTYSDVYYTRQMPLPLMDAAMDTADIVILEMAERRISELLDAAPTIPARETEVFSGIYQPESLAVFTKSEGDYLRIWGWVPKPGLAPDFPTGDSLPQIDILIRGDVGDIAYEAFPILERSLLSVDTMPGKTEENTAFSLLIPSLPHGEYEIVYRLTVGETESIYSGTIVL